MAAATAAAVEKTPKLVKPNDVKCGGGGGGAMARPSIGDDVGKWDLSITLC